MRISKANLPKISRFHHIPGSGTNGPHFLTRFLISLRFAYDFAFCQNNGFVKIITRKNTQNPLRWCDFVGAIPQIWYKTYGGLIGRKMSKNWNSRKLRYPKSRFFKDVPWFFLYFFKYFHDKYGVQGSITGPKNRKFQKFQNPSKKYWDMTGDLN